MIKNYLLVAWRNLKKNKVHTFINISGLSVGLACSLLILLWVQNELDVDGFHKNKERLFSVYERTYSDNKPEAGPATPGLLAPQLKKDIPEIEYASGVGFKEQHLFKVNNKILKLEGRSADSDFFKIFTYPLLQGNAATALNTVSSLAISRKMAENFFGSPANAIGKTIRYDNEKDFTITAVFENVPDNSSRKFEYLTNWNVFLQEYAWATDMNSVGPWTFILLRRDANNALVEKKIFHYMQKFFTDKTAEGYSAELGLQRYDEIYLHGNFTDGQISGGRIGYVNLFSIVSLFILLIACINFMNLTTARSVKRAKEIGLRKVVGAHRSSLVYQFMGESLLVTFIAVIISLGLLILLLPLFNQITQKEILLPFNQSSFWWKLLAITLITGIISGIYPALYLSSFNTVKVLKGTLKLNTGTLFFRKGLVVFQFVISIVLITGTILISRQINFIQSMNLGYERKNLVYVPLEGDLVSKYELFKNEALKNPSIQSISRIIASPANIQPTDDAIDWDGKNPQLRMEFTYAGVGYDFINTMKLKLLNGRDFAKDFPGDSTGFMINEAALKIIGYKDPVGKRLKFRGSEGRIIGLIKDFHFASLHDPIRPLIIPFGEKADYGLALIRTGAGKTREALASLETIYKKLNPDFPFSYSFIDEEYNELYQNEQIVGRLSKGFSFLAIFISCLGLLGMVIFTAEQRVKEIGIRKVLGASVSSLIVLLTKEFLLLVVIALIISLPIAWYILNNWLQSFAYHEPIHWWIFFLSGITILLVALATVSFQAITAALANPVKSLRAE